MIFSEYVRLLTEETHDSDDDVKEYIVCKTDKDSKELINASAEILYNKKLHDHVKNDNTYRDEQSKENHAIALHILNFANEKHDEMISILCRKIKYASKIHDNKKVKELLADIQKTHNQRVTDTRSIARTLKSYAVPYATQIGNERVKCILHYIGPIVKPLNKRTKEENAKSDNEVIYEDIDVWVRIVVDLDEKDIISAHVFDLRHQFIEHINKQKEYSTQLSGNDCIVTYSAPMTKPISFSLTENDFI